MQRWVAREFQGVFPEGTIPPRGTGRFGAMLVNADTALRHSAVWACLRLRADLISTFPVNTYRNMDNLAITVAKAPIIVTPGGDKWPMHHWLFASQWDLDKSGNAIGLITEVNGYGLPARIDLQPISMCSVIQRKGQRDPLYKIDGKEYTADKVWHERQFPVPGLPVGLSPISYAAWTVGEYLSIQQFALDWFGGGAVPKAYMRNKAKVLKGQEITQAKQWYRDVINNGDLMVFGADWEYDFIQAQQAGVEWLESRRFGLADVCRFFSCPADLIEAAISAPGSITYQNAVIRNLQFLVMNLQPAIFRREQALSALLPNKQYVKLATDELLRLDPATLATVLAKRIEWRMLTVSEARINYFDLPPLTSAQEAEFGRLFPPKSSPGPTPATPHSHSLSDWFSEDVEALAPRSPIDYPLREVVGS
jgi:HK97 family phage portal protein